MSEDKRILSLDYYLIDGIGDVEVPVTKGRSMVGMMRNGTTRRIPSPLGTDVMMKIAGGPVSLPPMFITVMDEDAVDLFLSISKEDIARLFERTYSALITRGIAPKGPPGAALDPDGQGAGKETI